MIDEGLLYGRGTSFPPRLGQDGRWQWSAGAENIRDAIRVILLTQQRERIMLPEFGGGLDGFLFQPNTVATHRLIQEQVTRALERWEPRIALESVTVAEDPADGQAAVVTITYKLVATGAGDQVTLAFRLSS